MPQVWPNAPLSGGSFATVSGLNFGAADYSSTAAFSSATCGTTAWSSKTSVLCKTRSVLNYPGFAELTVSAVTGTAQCFSFDAPVSSQTVGNAPYTAHEHLSILGLNFGTIDYTGTVAIGMAPCYTSQWSSSSSFRCRATPYREYPTFHSVTVAGLVGTGHIMSFDGPVLSAAFLNTPFSGGASLTVTGIVFGQRCAPISWPAILLQIL